HTLSPHFPYTTLFRSRSAPNAPACSEQRNLVSVVPNSPRPTWRWNLTEWVSALLRWRSCARDRQRSKALTHSVRFHRQVGLGEFGTTETKFRCSLQAGAFGADLDRKSVV